MILPISYKIFVIFLCLNICSEKRTFNLKSATEDFMHDFSSTTKFAYLGTLNPELWGHEFWC